MTDGREDFLAATNVSRETMAKLDAYADLLPKWSRRINLVAQKSLDQVWTRHFLDSAQLIDLAPKNFETWVDFGSGGGFVFCGAGFRLADGRVACLYSA